jgi:probable rRNA maturation factor
MEITLQIDQPFQDKIDQNMVERAVAVTLDYCQAGPAHSLAVVITDQETAQALNRQYRGLDAPTDVLSFAASFEADFPHSEVGVDPYLGDVIIAYPVAEAQARAAHHQPIEEVVLLTVHGLLHLLGFDHDTPAHKEAMWLAQAAIMNRLDLGTVQPTEV